METENQEPADTGANRLRSAWRWLFLVAAFLSPTLAAQNRVNPGETDGPAGADIASFAVQEAFGHSEWATLDGLLSRYCSPDEPRLDDGRWKLSGVSLSLESFFDAYGEWEMMFAKLAEWRREQPATTAADVVEAILWYSWAWAARGDGYAQNVTPEGMQLFRERLLEANDLLRRTRASAENCPLYHEARLRVLLGLGADQEEMRMAFEAGVSKFPDYGPLYYRRVIALLPWWGGSYEEIDAFVNEMVERDLGKEGEALYTRIWLWVDMRNDTGFDLFRDTPASWPRMREGYRLLLERHPRSMFILNSFAAHACRAQDAETYKSLRDWLTRPYYLPAWPTNLSIEVCDLRMIKSA